MRFELEPYTTCSFCRDLDGTRDCAFVARTEDAAAIVNERQYERGGMLVIPTRHHETILDVSPAEITAVHTLAWRVAAAAARAFGAVGMNVFQNSGAKAGQTEPHFHVHVVPRYAHSEPSRRFRSEDFPVIPLAEQRQIAAEVVAALQEQDPRGPASVVRAWVDAFNRADAAALAEFYAPDAINHQVPGDPVVGRDAIRTMFEREFAAASMVCIPEQVLEVGEWAVLEWRDPLGLRGCGFFQVRDGRIVVQRGYWDRLSFLRQHGLPLPAE